MRETYNDLNSNPNRIAFRKISNGALSTPTSTAKRSAKFETEHPHEYTCSRWNLKRTDPPRKYIDLYESPNSKQCLKEFLSCYKHLEAQGFYPVFSAVSSEQSRLPSHLHWKLYMELADLAKRDNKVNEARALFAISTRLNPYAHKSWLEHSKLEEECGRLELSRDLLLSGLEYCPFNDQLGVKYIKTEEKLGNFTESRHFLSALSGSSVEKNWKILLEGVMIEARCGFITRARQQMGILINHCSSVGAIYLEAVKFEEKWGNDLALAVAISEKGLHKISRYGPLWFEYLRIIDKLEYLSSQGREIAFTLQDLQWKRGDVLTQAVKCISKELIWKLYLEHAISCERKGKFEESRKFLKDSALNCPDNLRWKAWVVGARIELKAKQLAACWKLLGQSLEEVPAKQKPLVLVEFSKVHEFLLNTEKAREFMLEACEQSNQDWKVYLEFITMEMRGGDLAKATEIAQESLASFSSTGRLWAALIQLKHANRESLHRKLQFKAFLIALKEVPKSGEVWCEGARIRMNPFTEFYDLDKAEEYLNYAIQFTPQYGDSFIELLRLYMIRGKYGEIEDLKRLCVNADPNYGMLWFYCEQHACEGPKDIWERAQFLLTQELAVMGRVYTGGIGQEHYLDSMWSGLVQANKQFTHQRCLDQESRWKLIFGVENLVV